LPWRGVALYRGGGADPDAGKSEWPASAALDAVAAIRPRAWPNLLILEFGDALLGRNGEIVVAAGAIYRRVLARDPEFGDQMIDVGRDRLPRDRLTLCRVSRSGAGPD
jgi:hypothetical protein